MSGQRIALVVAIDQYQHAGLRQLVAPAADAAALAGVLADRDLGGFDVEVLHNVSSSAISERLEDVLTERQPSDLVMVHFSCHGLKDDAGELYLAATNTVPNRLASTAVDAALISRLMQRSRARRVVLLLDCCYGGAFERGVIARAGGDVDVSNQFTTGPLGGGRGRAIITASSAMEYAFEGGRLAEDAVAQPSLFTAALVEGLATGDADRDNDGHVALGELYEYVYDRVRERSPHQTPCKWEFGLQGELYLARNPRRRIVPGRLPPELVELTEHPHPDVRVTAVRLLEQAACESDLPRAAAARDTLTDLAEDDSRRVSTAARTALRLTGLRLSAPSLDLGQVTVGETARSSTVELKGPPLALELRTPTVTGPLNARIDGATVVVTWTPTEPGSLDAAVTLSGPAGEVRLAVTGRAVAPQVLVKAPEGIPRQAKLAVECPKRPILSKPDTDPGTPNHVPAPAEPADQGRSVVAIGLTVCGLVGLGLIVAPVGLVVTFLSGAATAALLGVASVWNLRPPQRRIRRWILLRFVPAIPVIVIGAYAGSYGLYQVASGREIDAATHDPTVVGSTGYLVYRAVLVVLALGLYAFWVWSFRRAARAAARSAAT